MKKITFLIALFIAAISYGQTVNGFIINPSFEDGPGGAITKGATVDNWKFDGQNAAVAGVSANIQSTNVHVGDGTKAFELINPVVGAGDNKLFLYSTEHSFAGNNTDEIEVTISFWIKTTGSLTNNNSSGDIKILLFYALDGGVSGSKTIRVGAGISPDTWTYISDTYSLIAASSNYGLYLRFQIGSALGTTQIDGLTSTVSGGATLALEGITKDDTNVFVYPNPATDVLNYKAEGVKSVEVYNLLGQKVIASKATGSVEVATLPSGIYVLKLKGDNGVVSTKKFMVK